MGRKTNHSENGAEPLSFVGFVRKQSSQVTAGLWASIS